MELIPSLPALCIERVFVHADDITLGRCQICCRLFYQLATETLTDRQSRTAVKYLLRLCQIEHNPLEDERQPTLRVTHIDARKQLPATNYYSLLDARLKLPALLRSLSIAADRPPIKAKLQLENLNAEFAVVVIEALTASAFRYRAVSQLIVDRCELNALEDRRAVVDFFQMCARAENVQFHDFQPAPATLFAGMSAVLTDGNMRRFTNLRSFALRVRHSCTNQLIFHLCQLVREHRRHDARYVDLSISLYIPKSVEKCHFTGDAIEDLLTVFLHTRATCQQCREKAEFSTAGIRKLLVLGGTIRMEMLQLYSNAQQTGVSLRRINETCEMLIASGDAWKCEHVSEPSKLTTLLQQHQASRTAANAAAAAAEQSSISA